MTDMEKWLKSGEYLPDVLRDFHDQKNTFKAIHHLVQVQGIHGSAPVDWVSGHCYVIDVFLWWMAKRGYTLQRSRKKIDFSDIVDDRNKDCQQRINSSILARPS